MIKNIISLVLLVFSVLLNFKHGWDSFKTPTAEQQEMMTELGVSQTYMPYFGVFAIVIAVLQLIPKTFFLGNVLNAFTIILIMCSALRVGNFKMVLIEIPFLIIPLVLIWLKYPFKS